MKRSMGLLIVAMLVAVGCAKKDQVVMPTDPDIPIWAQRMSGKCVEIPERHVSADSICGIGIAENIDSYSLGMETAATNARREIGHVLESEVASFNQVVQESLSRMGATDEIQKVQAATEGMMRQTLSGVVVPATYHDKERNTFFALAMIDYETFEQALTQIGDAAALSEQAKAEVQRRAEGVLEAWRDAEDRER